MTVLAGAVALRAQDNWVQQSPAASPGIRVRAAMAYDPLQQQTVLFGGTDALAQTVYGDTWLWDGNTWSAATPASSPSARAMSAIAYDATRQQEVLFGGRDATNTLVGDTWVWDGGNWAQKNPASAPSARRFHAMAYDALHQQLVLFGGITAVNGSFVVVGDTWVWDGSNWTQMSPSTSPSARSGHVMAYDAARQRVVLFGGVGGLASNSTVFGDTWVWDGSNWTPETPATSPPAREGAVMTYDDTNQRSLLFGGTTSPVASSSTLLGDTWAWDGSSWAQLMPAASPPARINAQLAYDSAHEQAVLFGGVTLVSGVITGFGDTWLFGNPAAQTPVTIDVPAGIQFTFNGVTYTGSQTINVAPATYTLSTASPQLVINGSRVVWASWSNGGTQSQQVTVGTTAISITGTYTTQYLLTESVSPAGAGSISPPGGYYDSGTMLDLTVIQNPGYVFAAWGSACAGASFSGCSITLSGPTSVSASFTSTFVNVTVNVPAGVQFTFNGSTFTGSQTMAVAPGTYTLGTASPQDIAPNTRDVWVSWSDGGDQTHQVVAPATITGTYKTQYNLRVTVVTAGFLTSGGSVSPDGGYFDAGTEVNLSASAAVGFEFSYWSGDCTGSLLTCPVVMNAPKSVTAVFGAIQNWNQFFPAKSPSPRVDHSMAYDAAHQQVVLFGGTAGITTGSELFNDTWLWDGSTWVRQKPVNSPSPRYGAAIAYDEAHSQIVLFGGVTSTTQLTLSGETWIWDPGHNTWILQNVSGPSPRYKASMAYDSNTHQLILFGGGTSAVNAFADTWAWNGTGWKQLTTSPVPAATFEGMAADPRTGRIIRVDGFTMWEWNGSDWLRRSVSPSPAVVSAILAFNPPTNEVLLFGWNTKNRSPETWAWDGSNWIRKMPVSSPSARDVGDMATGPGGQGVVLFGGVDLASRLLNDTWVWLTPSVRFVPQLPTVTKDGGGNYVVTMPLANQGNVPITNVIMLSGGATLGPASSKSTGFIAAIEPGTTGTLSAKFKQSDVPGNVATVTMQGTYSADGVVGVPWSATFVVLLP